MMLIPLRTLVYGMESIVDVMRDLESTAASGDVVLIAGDTERRLEPAGDYVAATSIPLAPDPVVSRSQQLNQEFPREKKMDKNLNDDMLKLVRFKILFVKRGYEQAFDEQEVLVWDNIDSTAFTAWKVAEFIQTLAKRETHVPGAWGHYPASPSYRDGNFLIGLPEEDKKYLRVYFEVLERYHREKFRYEEQQIAVLESIRDCLCAKP